MSWSSPRGLLIAAIAGYWIVPHLGWRWMFVVGALPAVIVVYLRRRLPESPRWLERAGRSDDAERTLSAQALATPTPNVRTLVG